MHYTKLPAAIARGHLDDILGPLTEACNARRKALVEAEAIEARSLPPGTRVALTRIRPKYMAGLTGEVISAAKAREHYAVVREGCINVELDDASFLYAQSKSTRRRSSKFVTVPASCIEVRVSPAAKEMMDA